MFLGEFTHNLDSKARLTIPAKFRNALANGIVVTRNPADSCLLVFPRAEWDRLAEKVSALPLTDPKSSQFRRAFFSAAEDLRTYAQIDADVVVAGMNKFIELWTPSLWEQKVLAPMDSGDFNSDFFTTLSI